MIEYKNDEAFNFETVEQESLTKEYVIKELESFIAFYEKDLNNDAEFNFFNAVTKTIMKHTLSEFKDVFEKIKE